MKDEKKRRVSPGEPASEPKPRVASDISATPVEAAEPSAARVNVPVLLIAFLGLMVYLGDMYLMDHSGSFSAKVYYPYLSLDELPVADGGTEQGKVAYGKYCVACHQPNGAGNAAINIPPLAGSEWVTEEGPAHLIRIVLNGLTGPIEVKGVQYNNTMLPWRDTMDDEEIAAVLSYIRNEWGNQAPPVETEHVSAVRQATLDRASNWTAQELFQIPPGI